MISQGILGPIQKHLKKHLDQNWQISPYVCFMYGEYCMDPNVLCLNLILTLVTVKIVMIDFSFFWIL